MTVTLNIKPEFEVGLVARAAAAGVSLEEYIEQLIEKEIPAEVACEEDEKSGMVWEDGLLVYGAGSPLPPGFLDRAVERSREERSQAILGKRP